MGYPLQIFHFCALLLYCERSCGIQFTEDLLQFNTQKWKCLDSLLNSAITILSHYERREEFDEYVYYGLPGIYFHKFENILNQYILVKRKEEEKETREYNQIKEGHFTIYIRATKDWDVAKSIQGEKGSILKFHPSMRRSENIVSADVEWILSEENKQTILFSRTSLFVMEEEKFSSISSNLKISNINEKTHIWKLKSLQHHNHYQTILHINAIFENRLDRNIIWILLTYFKCDVVELLLAFEEWKKNALITLEYKNSLEIEFKKHRCWNHQINLFCIFLKTALNSQFKLMQNATAMTMKGLPWYEKD